MTTRSIGFCFALAASATLSVAQTADSRAAEQAKATLVQRRADFAQSAALYLSGQTAAADQALLATSPQKAGSAAWYHDAGVQQYNMAIYLRAQRAEAQSRTLIAQSIQNLDLATTLAKAQGKTTAAAASQRQIGSIYEFFLNDANTALVRTKAAQLLDPTAKNLDLDLARLGRASEQLGAKKTGK